METPAIAIAVASACVATALACGPALSVVPDTQLQLCQAGTFEQRQYDLEQPDQRQQDLERPRYDYD